jgi:carboxypeptidase Taq
MMAAQLFAAARVAIPEIPAQIGRGQFTELVAWLRQHVHHLGSSVSVDEVLVNATGQALTTEPFLAHLRSRYLAE